MTKRHSAVRALRYAAFGGACMLASAPGAHAQSSVTLYGVTDASILYRGDFRIRKKSYAKAEHPLARGALRAAGGFFSPSTSRRVTSTSASARPGLGMLPLWRSAARR